MPVAASDSTASTPVSEHIMFSLRESGTDCHLNRSWASLLPHRKQVEHGNALAILSCIKRSLLDIVRRFG